MKSSIRKLTEVSRAISDTASLDEVLQLTVDRATDLVGAERALLVVANDDGILALRSSHGVDAELGARFHEPLDESLVPRLAELLDVPPARFIGVPLVVAGRVKGILAVVRPISPAGAEEDEWLLSALADQAAVALEKTRLTEIGEFRDQLMGIVGHDLRNPLNTIVMASHVLLQREGLGARETELARKITNGALLAVRLIEQLLDLTRSRLGGGIPVDPRPLDLSEVCRQVAGELELTHPERPLHVDLRGDLKGVWDRDRMYQLIGNLVGNAVAHGEPESPIELRVDGTTSELGIEVANCGKPIPPEAITFIFDAFRQGRRAHASRSHGLGLGLFIAQQIARSHGGAISVTSSEHEGTTFRVKLPRGS
jgi:sigma-B regulation protein RsbU (phosphoserine phosphatase)